MNVLIGMHEEYAEAIAYFINVANSSQEYLRFHAVQLTYEESKILKPRKISETAADLLLERLFRLKIAKGHKRGEPLIVFYDGQISDPKGGDPDIMWLNTVYEEEDPPGVAIISLSYLGANETLQAGQSDRNIEGNSINLNLLCALVMMTTSLECHYQTSGCIMDFCFETKDINVTLKKGFHFCEKHSCRQSLQKTEMGKAILTIASALNNRPFRSRSGIQMIPRCFKTNTDKCIKAPTCIPNRVFVAMPFKAEFDDIFDFGIDVALSELEYEPWKADEHPANIDVMCKLCENIQLSEYAIVDLSVPNNNVYFELGLCYALGRRVLIVKREGSEEATDLKGIEYISYKSASDLRKKLLEYLPKIFL